MFVDSHCHLDCLDLSNFDNKLGNLINHTRNAGVEHILCVSINLDSYPGMLELVRDYPDISVSAGLHPLSDQYESFTADLLTEMASDSKVVAIGETGLDYYYHKDSRQTQQQHFRAHIQVARQLDKPLIVHTRDAGADTLDILRQENAQQCGGVIHCFTETREFAEQALDMGFMISFSGIVTFSNAARLREVAKIIPDEQLLIETDSPYLAPVPYRGKQNQPDYVQYVAAKLAEVRNTSIEHIAEITSKNFYRVFDITSKGAAQ